MQELISSPEKVESTKGNLDGSYHQTSRISGTLVGNKIVDHSDVVGASLIGVAPTTYSFST